MKITLVSANADDEFITVNINETNYQIYIPIADDDMWHPEEALADILDAAGLKTRSIIGDILNNGVFESEAEQDNDFEPRREVFLQPFRGKHRGRVSVWNGREFVDYILRGDNKQDLRARCRKLLREKQTVKTHDFHAEDQPCYDIDYADGSWEFMTCGVDRKGNFYWWD